MRTISRRNPAGRTWLAALVTAWLALPAAAAADTGGLVLDGAYLGEYAHNLDGGLRRGGDYLDRFDLALGGPLFGSGATFRVHGMATNAGRFSERYVGDAMTVSNIDAPYGLRLYEAWVEWPGGEGGAGSLRAGFYDLNSEFDTSEVRATLTHSVFGIGHDVAQTGEEGPSIFPNTALGLRGALALGEQWRVQAVALDAVPGKPGDPAAVAIRFGDGALLVGELQRHGERVTKAALGVWSYTEASEALSATAAPRRNRGAYLSLDAALAGDFGAGQGTAGFLRYGFAEDTVNEYDAFAALGVAHRWDRGELERSAALGVAAAWASPAYRTLLAQGGDRPARYEGVVELTLRAALTSWLLVQPYAQYVVNPSATREIPDSLVAGVRFHLSWSGTVR